MSTQKILILRGLPGSGKSTFVRETLPDAIICSADNFHTDSEGNYNFDPAKGPEAHRQCFLEYMDCVRCCGEETSIVVDNTNISAWECAPYVAVANAYEREYLILNFIIDVKFSLERNVHGVPEHVIQNMASRLKEPLPPFWKQADYDEDGRLDFVAT